MEKRAYYFSFKASPAAVYSLFGSSPSSESYIAISANHCKIYHKQLEDKHERTTSNENMRAEENMSL